MFTGLTVAGIITDALDFAAEFAIPISVLIAFWAGRRMLSSARGFFGG